MWHKKNPSINIHWSLRPYGTVFVIWRQKVTGEGDCERDQSGKVFVNVQQICGRMNAYPLFLGRHQSPLPSPPTFPPTCLHSWWFCVRFTVFLKAMSSESTRGKKLSSVPSLIAYSVSAHKTASCTTGGLSSSCEMIILQSTSHGEIIRVCVGIFTTALCRE